MDTMYAEVYQVGRYFKRASFIDPSLPGLDRLLENLNRMTPPTITRPTLFYLPPMTAPLPYPALLMIIHRTFPSHFPAFHW